MKLVLRNTGRISEAEISLDGITVIAGRNNTGKSTVSKALFCMVNTVCGLRERIRQEKLAGVEKAAGFYCGNCLREIMDLTEAYLRKSPTPDEQARYEKQLREILDSQAADILAESLNINSRDAADKILRVLTLSDAQFTELIALKYFSAAFAGQTTDLRRDDAGEVRLENGSESFKVSVLGNHVLEARGSAALPAEAIYIDNPLVIDEISNYRTRCKDGDFDYRRHLIEKLALPGKHGLADALLAEERLRRVNDRLSAVCRGEVVRQGEHTNAYRMEGSPLPLRLENLSSGLKNFVILQTLLRKGAIEQNSVLILDEPEIHLHPEWQLVLAELIVLLREAFDLRVLLTTHSPYFLRAIQVFAFRQKASEKVRFYLAENAGDRAEIREVTDRVDSIYAELAKPFRLLDETEWADDGLV